MTVFYSCCLALLVFAPTILGSNPGVEVRLTQKGLEYGRQIGMASIQKKLQTISIPDMSGKERVKVGKVEYRLSNMHIVNVGLPSSTVNLVPGGGVTLAISNAFINLKGNWRVKYLRRIRDSGSFELNVNQLSVSATMAISSDPTGRPDVSSTSCTATVGSARIKFRGGASWLYNLFSKYIDRALRKAMEKQICPLVTKAISDVNPHLKTLNVLAEVDKYAEVEYSMVRSPTVSQSYIDLSLKGEFYNIGRHQEPPFAAQSFSLPPNASRMLYIGLSAFTLNSAAFVYERAGALSLYVTDDMVPRISPIRLNTKTFGTFVPEIAKRFPNLMVKLLVRASTNPVVRLEPGRVAVQANGTVTAYAIQANGTLTPLFMLNLETDISAQVLLKGMRLAAAVTLNRMSLTLATSYVGDFQVRALDSVLQMVLKLVVIPTVNVQLAKGYPLPALGQMELVDTQLQIFKDFLQIGTDVSFTT
ncbi:bactericidal permeability-increasing protein-like [Nelusetta ayraudi]|uniref:bactericidal permeability-increasing protein-like n=1 Tax=Nelusetta ayraudi TaxID=303726 RepID=UPI003F6E7184